MTLELGLAGVPTVLAYRVSLFEEAIARALITTDMVGLANLILGEKAMPELLQRDATPEKLAAHLVALIGDTPERRRQCAALARLDAAMEVGAATPSARAAAIVLAMARPGRFHRRIEHANRDNERDRPSDMNDKPETRPPNAIRAAITGVHGSLPDYVLTNAELAAMVDTTDSWIIERTGIKERRILKGEGLGTSHMACGAVKGLLEKTRTAPAEIDLLICATTTPDMVFPSTANLVCDMVGIRNIGSFDVQAACSGFIYALTIAAQFVETGRARKVVVVGADKMSAIIDYTDRATCVLFGDGAGAVMVEPSRDAHGIVDMLIRSDGAGMPFLHQKAGGSRMPPTEDTVAKRLHYVHQEGAAVYKFAVAKMAEVAGELMKRNALHRGRHRLAGAAPGQPADHRSDRRAHGRAARARHDHHPEIRQHHRGDDPAVPVGIREPSRARRQPHHGGIRRRLHLGRRLRDLGRRVKARSPD